MTEENQLTHTSDVSFPEIYLSPLGTNAGGI